MPPWQAWRARASSVASTGLGAWICKALDVREQERVDAGAARRPCSRGEPESIAWLPVLLGSKQQRFGTEKPGRDAAEILPAMVPALGFAGSFGARGFLASVYMPLALDLCLDPPAEQLREPAYGSHAPRLLVPLEVHPDADGASQLAREVAAWAQNF